MIVILYALNFLLLLLVLVEPVQFQNINETLEKINGIVRNETDGHIQEAIFRDDLLKVNHIYLFILMIVIL